MALSNNEKQISALLVQKNSDVDYMLRISGDEVFAREEMSSKKEVIKEELLKEKESHESHMSVLTARLEKLTLLLLALEEIQNGNE